MCLMTDVTKAIQRLHTQTHKNVTRYGSYIEEQCNGSKSYSIHITRDCWISRWETPKNMCHSNQHKETDPLVCNSRPEQSISGKSTFCQLLSLHTEAVAVDGYAEAPPEPKSPEFSMPNPPNPFRRIWLEETLQNHLG